MEYYARVCFLLVVLLLDALENSDISLDLWSHEISNFPTHLEVNTTDRKHTRS